MAQMVASLLLDGPPARWRIKEGTDSSGEPFILAETTDMIIGVTARDSSALKFFAASLLSAIRQHETTAEITERDPIGL